MSPSDSAQQVYRGRTAAEWATVARNADLPLDARFEAVRALGDMVGNNNAVLATLFELVAAPPDPADSNFMPVYRLVPDVFRKSGKRAVPLLLREMVSDNARRRRIASLFFGHRETDSLADLKVAFAAGSAVERERLLSEYTLSAYTPVENRLTVLTWGLNDPDDQVRSVVSSRLGSLGAIARSVISLSLADPRVRVLRTALEAVVKLRGAEAIDPVLPQLQALLGATDPEIREVAGAVLASSPVYRYLFREQLGFIKEHDPASRVRQAVQTAFDAPVDADDDESDEDDDGDFDDELDDEEDEEFDDDELDDDEDEEFDDDELDEDEDEEFDDDVSDDYEDEEDPGTVATVDDELTGSLDLLRTCGFAGLRWYSTAAEVVSSLQKRGYRYDSVPDENGDLMFAGTSDSSADVVFVQMSRGRAVSMSTLLSPTDARRAPNAMIEVLTQKYGPPSFLDDSSDADATAHDGPTILARWSHPALFQLTLGVTSGAVIIVYASPLWQAEADRRAQRHYRDF